VRFVRRFRSSDHSRRALAFCLSLWPFLIPLFFESPWDDLETLIKLSLITFGIGWLVRRMRGRFARFVEMLISLLNFPARRRRYREMHGLCIECAFDLRASPDRCPECGAIAVRGPWELGAKGS